MFFGEILVDNSWGLYSSKNPKRISTKIGGYGRFRIWGLGIQGLRFKDSSVEHGVS